MTGAVDMPVLQVLAKFPFGWLVRVVRFQGSGVAIWQRKVKTLSELHEALNTAAKLRREAEVAHGSR